MKRIATLLRDYGLSEREAKVYIHLVKNIEDSLLGISKATNIPRTSLYAIMEDLKARHLVSSFQKNKSRYWMTESIQQLDLNLQKQNKSLKKVLPMLRSVAGNDFMDSESVRVFSGKEGMKAVWEDIITTLEDNREPFVYAISSRDLYEYLPRYFPRWIERRQKNGTYARLILEEGHDHTHSGTYQEVRHVDRKYIQSGDVTLYGSKVAFFAFDKKKASAVIIDSKIIYDLVFGMFSFMWDRLTPKT